MAAGIAVLVSGCGTGRITQPQRTATEQLLISTAADRALEQINVEPIRGRKVYLDTSFFVSTDKEYAIGAIRDVLSSGGALLVSTANEADVIVEARSGALSIDNADSLVGLPSLPVPIPFVGMTQTPEVALLKSQKQDSIAKIALLAYHRETRAHLFSQRPVVGTAHHYFYQILIFIKYQRTDMPEKQIFRKWRDRQSKDRRSGQEP